MFVNRDDLCFFKQKTVYDLRISDWSSDVCSSDLVQVEQRTDLGVDAEARAGSHRIAVVARRVVLIEVAPPHEGLHLQIRLGRHLVADRQAETELRAVAVVVAAGEVLDAEGLVFDAEEHQVDRMDIYRHERIQIATPN